jgi:cell division topological specificity factor
VALNIFKNFFGKRSESTENAKSRLHFVLVQDRSGLQQEELNGFRREMIAVIEKYFQINEEDFDISYQRGEETTTLVINSPVTLKRVANERALSKRDARRNKKKRYSSSTTPQTLTKVDVEEADTDEAI